MSGIIAAVIMIALVLAATAIVWGIVENMLQKQIKSSESCFGNYDKITINSRYTCYTLISSDNYTVQFSLNIGDIEVDKVIVSVSSEGTSKSYTLVNGSGVEVVGLGNYPNPNFGTDLIRLPVKNAGLTYVASGFIAKADLIKIAPVINDQQCEISDTLANIGACF